MKSSIIKNRLYDIRQFFYPKPFRIYQNELRLPNLDQAEKSFENLIQLMESNSGTVNKTPETNGRDPAQDQRFMAGVATSLWRIRSGMIRPGSDEPYQEVKRGFNKLNRLIGMMEDRGIRIVDKTGDFYDPGMMMTVISSEPMPDIQREIIKETIEPMILNGDTVVQTAQVIIGIPMESTQDLEQNSSEKTNAEKE